MNLFSRLSRPGPSQSRPDGLHLERVTDDGPGSPVKPVPARWPGRMAIEEVGLDTDDLRRALRASARRDEPALPGNWADSPLATRLQHHLDEITADRDALALANGRLVARIREQDATITDLTARLEEA